MKVRNWFAFYVSAVVACLVVACPVDLRSEKPPGGLAPLLHECDISAAAGSVCTIWVWDGHAYAATWPNGAIGQMTVADANPHALLINRVDTAGTVSGLTAKYKGKWDGKQILDGVVPWTWRDKSGTSTWTATPVRTPAACISPGYIENYYPARLTTWVFAADPKPDGRVFGLYGETTDDVLIAEQPFEGIRPFDGGRNQNYFFAVAQEFDTRITAAIFADGSAFGDRKQIDAIMATRVKVVDEYTQVFESLCKFASQPDVTREQIRESLWPIRLRGKQQALGFFSVPLGKDETLASKIQGALDRVQQTRALLLAPV